MVVFPTSRILLRNSDIRDDLYLVYAAGTVSPTITPVSTPGVRRRAVNVTSVDAVGKVR